MEKSTSRNVLLGILVIAGLIVFVVGIYSIGDKQSMFGNTTKVYAVFHNVSGLKLGNNVRYSGLNIGTVKDIKLKNDSLIFVEMVIDVDVMPHIKKGATASISSDGLVGNMVLNIDQGKPTEASITSGDTLLAKSRVGTDQLIESLGVTSRNIEQISEDLKNITSRIAGGKGLIGTLLNDGSLSNELTQAMHFLKVTGQKTDATMTEINLLVKSMDKPDNVIGMIKDTALVSRIKRMLANLENTSSEMNTVVKNLNTTVLKARDGKGLINYLSNDVSLVRKIDSTATMLDVTMGHLNEASIKLNDNLEALKHNFLFRGYFKNLEKERLKQEKDKIKMPKDKSKN